MCHCYRIIIITADLRHDQPAGESVASYRTVIVNFCRIYNERSTFCFNDSGCQWQHDFNYTHGYQQYHQRLFANLIWSSQPASVWLRRQQISDWIKKKHNRGPSCCILNTCGPNRLISGKLPSGRYIPSFQPQQNIEIPKTSQITPFHHSSVNDESWWPHIYTALPR